MSIDLDYYWQCAEVLQPMMKIKKLEGGVDYIHREEAIKRLKKAGIKLKVDEETECLTDEYYWPLEDYLTLSYNKDNYKQGLKKSLLLCWPASEFFRAARNEDGERDWESRWNAAGESVAWEGACISPMVALKTSPIWQALGNGVGGYEHDAFGYPFPPFAPHSWMSVRDITFTDCVKLGLC